MRKYLQNYDLFEYVKSFYIKRLQEIKEREKMLKFDFSKVRDSDLEKAGLSRK